MGLFRLILIILLALKKDQTTDKRYFWVDERPAEFTLVHWPVIGPNLA
jgi:hypothetical protein